MSPTPTYQPPEPQRSGLLTALVAGGLIALVAANIYLYVQVDHVRDGRGESSGEADHRTQQSAGRVTSVTRLAARHLETMKEELEAARTQARDQRTFSSQAKAEAQAHADQIAKQMQEEAKVQQQMSREISEVKGRAGGEHGECEDRRRVHGRRRREDARLRRRRRNCRRRLPISSRRAATSGVQSGLIATNAQELPALKRLGERNYIEIKLGQDQSAAALRRHHAAAEEDGSQEEQVHRAT